MPRKAWSPVGRHPEREGWTRSEIVRWLEESRAHEFLLLAVEKGSDEIVDDVLSERMPADVRDFGELHDFVDANQYGGLFDIPLPGLYMEEQGFTEEEKDWVMEWAANVQELLHQWIKEKGLRQELARRGKSQHWMREQSKRVREAKEKEWERRGELEWRRGLRRGEA